MIISHTHKLLYVHIPKTGGTTIHKYIREGGGIIEVQAHAPLKEDTYNDYIKTVIVRNSWQLCVSCYMWECITRKCVLYPGEGINSFEDWLIVQKNNIQECKYPKRYLYPKQLTFFSSTNGKILVDRIIPFEDIKTELINLCSKLNIKYNPQIKERSSKYKDWKSFYNDTTYNLVYDMCKEDIKYFNWEFK